MLPQCHARAGTTSAFQGRACAVTLPFFLSRGRPAPTLQRNSTVSGYYYIRWLGGNLYHPSDLLTTDTLDTSIQALVPAVGAKNQFTQVRRALFTSQGPGPQAQSKQDSGVSGVDKCSQHVAKRYGHLYPGPWGCDSCRGRHHHLRSLLLRPSRRVMWRPWQLGP